MCAAWERRRGCACGAAGGEGGSGARSARWGTVGSEVREGVENAWPQWRGKGQHKRAFFWGGGATRVNFYLIKPSWTPLGSAHLLLLLSVNRRKRRVWLKTSRALKGSKDANPLDERLEGFLYPRSGWF